MLAVGLFGGRGQHSRMAVGVEGVHIALAVDQRRNGVRMDEGHVIDLHIGFHRDLPVALQVKAVAGRQPDLVESEFLPLVPDRTQPFFQRHRLCIEIDKNQIAQHLALDRDQAAAGHVEIRTKILLFGHADQSAIGLVGPVVIAAHQAGRSAPCFGHNRCAAMAAGVVKGTDLAIHAVDDDDRISDLLPFHEASRFRYLVNMAGEQPGLLPQILLFEVVIFLAGIAPGGQVREMGKVSRWGGASRFPLHQAFHLIDIGRIHRHPYSPSPPICSHGARAKSIGKYDRRRRAGIRKGDVRFR